MFWGLFSLLGGIGYVADILKPGGDESGLRPWKRVPPVPVARCLSQLEQQLEALKNLHEACSSAPAAGEEMKSLFESAFSILGHFKFLDKNKPNIHALVWQHNGLMQELCDHVRASGQYLGLQKPTLQQRDAVYDLNTRLIEAVTDLQELLRHKKSECGGAPPYWYELSLDYFDNWLRDLRAGNKKFHAACINVT